MKRNRASIVYYSGLCLHFVLILWILISFSPSDFRHKYPVPKISHDREISNIKVVSINRRCKYSLIKINFTRRIWCNQII